MLQELTIRNLALIDSLQVELEPGFNVFTGETGAGKSILINAISLILGDRAPADVIKAGAESAIVDAIYSLPRTSEIEELLEAAGLQPEFDEQNERITLIVSREVGPRARSRINGRPVPLHTLKLLGQALVDLHGQHDHQSLLNPEQHLEFLDRFGGAPLLGLRQEVRSLVAELTRVERQLRELIQGERERAQRVDLLQFQRNEIDAAHLQNGEEQVLREERERLRHAEQLRSSVAEVLSLIGGDAEELGCLSRLGSALPVLRSASRIDQKLEQTTSDFETAYYHLEEVARSLRDYLEKLEADPSRLEEVESRLHLIHQLKRKYGDDVASILAYREKIAAELQSLTVSDEKIEELRKEGEILRDKLSQLAGQLSQKRREVSRNFRQTILAHLRDLGMEKSRFEAKIEHVPEKEGIPVDGARVRVTEKGADVVEFMISPNVGQPLKPLSRIASGGELSRIMLAIKCVLTERHHIPTLIFDEIDVGIGGSTAKSVGEKLKHLSRYAQVLCVTHLPQIAARADAHFLVEKHSTAAETSITLRKLTEEERVEEIARMLGGERSRSIARRHAEELLATAKETA